MKPIEFADILTTELQLAHTGCLTHALCGGGAPVLPGLDAQCGAGDDH